ncbi:hypothetical protein BGZ65_008490 [Modicella reniformis]|uniref:DUF4604 domain-containing protein n=1 Tax=Modicella reniformis TaxID=1440133 RepID=A0A9P6JH07_9FUNG|nr:hypothetical protein BGZ65_008490 [Modicella reniformis]
MSNKKITPHQMRKNLSYVQEGGPDFMRMLTGQSSSSAANNDPRNPYRKPIGIEAKFQTEEENDDEDEDSAHDLLNEREEERPTVVVLKDKKHLDERQVRNVLKNLPPGLSEAEIQKRLIEEMEKDTQDEDDDDSEDDDDDNDQTPPVDANGKILFRRPKGSSSSKSKDKKNTGSKNKSFEETLLREATVKANELKRKTAGINSSNASSKSKEGGGGGDTKDTSGGSEATKKNKKKQKTTKTTTTTTSLLSFEDEE